MSKTYYNKLVRDRIPGIIKSQDKTCEIEILDDEAYLRALEAKLDEEVREFHENPSIEELADILTVVTSIGLAMGISDVLLEQVMIQKYVACGGFNDKILLKWVVDGREKNE